jgi:excisionase family DNA binding protein
VPDNEEEWLPPREVAWRFGVTSKTVTRWAKEGKLPFIRTIGGQRRYPASRIKELMEENK